MHKIFKPSDRLEDYNFEETCPHCDSACPVIIDDSCYKYQVSCPVCGEKIMLCTLCMWAQNPDGNSPGDCDWTKEHGCFRMKEVAGNGNH